MTPLPHHGLYAITAAADTDPARLASRHRRRDRRRGGHDSVPRERPNDGERRTNAAFLLDTCRTRRVPLIVNDDPVLAAEIGADGVHVGRDDGGVRAARRIAGDRCIVGVSCYDRLDLATAAADDGATYVAFGSFFASPTKPHACAAPIGLLAAAREKLDVPIVAIGGITAHNGAALIEAGASFLAAIGGVFGEDDVGHAARGYAALFS